MRAIGAIICVAAGVYPALGLAQTPEIFKGADLKLGTQLIAEHQCNSCHARKVGGDGTAMYKPAGKFNTAGLLRGMVEMCNTDMNLGRFPEDVTAIAATLNQSYYKHVK